ncbi:MAG: hypothetical protein AB7T49_08515 [Oligoflexales bacterium]
MKIALTLLLAVLSFESLAQSRHTYKRRDSRPSPRTVRPLRTPESDRWGIAANSGLIYLGTGFGTEGWYQVSKDTHIGLQWLSTSSELVSRNINGSNTYESLEARAQVIQGYFRYLFWGSFGVSATLGTANIKGVWGYKNADDPTKNLLTSYESRLLLSSAALGNHVQFDNGVTLGLDWFGTGFILSQKAKAKSEDTALKDATAFLADNTPEEQIASRVKDNFKYYLLVFRFGYAF